MFSICIAPYLPFILPTTLFYLTFYTANYEICQNIDSVRPKIAVNLISAVLTPLQFLPTAFNPQSIPLSLPNIQIRWTHMKS